MTGEAAALVVLVPEAEPVVGPSRTLHTQDGAAGMPAHVTLLYPFAPIDMVDIDAVRQIAAAALPFAYELRAVHEWPDGVVYLEPNPDVPFVEPPFSAHSTLSRQDLVSMLCSREKIEQDAV